MILTKSIFLRAHLQLEFFPMGGICIIIHIEPILRRSEKKWGMTNVQWVWRGEDVGFVASINPQPTNQPTSLMPSCHQAKLLINTPINFLLSAKIAFFPLNIILEKRADGLTSLMVCN